MIYFSLMLSEGIASQHITTAIGGGFLSQSQQPPPEVVA
jgi:hypothetical protein